MCMCVYVYVLISFLFSSLNTEKGPKFGFRGERGPFQPSNGHNSRNTYDNHSVLYIFEISIDFFVDWYIIHWSQSIKFWYD